MHITFDNPWYLLLIPVVAIFLLITQKFMFSREKGVKLGQILVRAILFLALIFALAGLNVKFTGKNTTTIYLLDVSDSVRNHKSEVVNFVNESAKDKRKHDNVGIIAFGENSKVEQFISENIVFNKFQTDVNVGATNLEEAVAMAIAQLPKESAGRIVLITDGNENEGSLKSIAPEVIASGCTFEIKKLDEDMSDEVYVSDMSIPSQSNIGENFNIEVEVESNVACDATVKLYAGRTLKGEKRVHLQKGTNQLIFTDTQGAEGLKTYKVVVESEKDTITVNNEYSAYTNIEIQMPLLIVEGVDGNAYNYKKMLDAMDVEYTSATPGTVPTDMATLMQYSAVVFVDVFEGDLRDGFLPVLNDYVKNNGGGFIITGGSNSYALGGYRDTIIEDMAPVNMDLNPENEVPDMAMVMVIDHSGSMDAYEGVQTRLDLAKESAAAAIDYLRPTDSVEVIVFDDTYSKAVPFTKVDDPEDIKKKIAKIPDGGGTSIYPALQAAVRDINEQNAMIKHIILLTDGEDYNEDYDDLLEIIKGAGITLSCVAVGDNTNAQLLERLALEGNGRIFYSDATTDLPRIFAQEVFLASNTYLVNEVFVPTVTSNDQIIRGLTDEGMPALYGYVATTKKDRAIQVLESYQNDPILAYWQYGLGKTVAWTSDVSGEWTAEYSNWDKYMVLWNNIIKLVSEENGMEGTSVHVEQNGNKATVTYYTDQYDAGTQVTGYVYDSEGNAKEVTLDPKKPGVYETVIDTKETGIYTINVQQQEQGEVVSSINTAAIMQYSLEYRFYPNNTLLEDFASSTGAVFIDKPQDVFANVPEFVKARFGLWLPLLILAAFMFLLDIAFRRFHFSLAFVDKSARKMEENKAIREEKKKKQAADKIKKETEQKVENVKETKSEVVKSATKKAPEAKKQPVSVPTKTYEKKPGTVTPPPTETKKEMNFANLKKSQVNQGATTNNQRVLEKNTTAKPGNASTQKPSAPKKPTEDKKSSENKSTGSVIGSQSKTRVWVRDNK